MIDWTCHAHPAGANGKPCGHLNSGEPTYHSAGFRKLQICKGCGCTKKASDDRLAKKESRS